MGLPRYMSFHILNVKHVFFTRLIVLCHVKITALGIFQGVLRTCLITPFFSQEIGKNAHADEIISCS